MIGDGQLKKLKTEIRRINPIYAEAQFKLMKKYELLIKNLYKIEDDAKELVQLIDDYIYNQNVINKVILMSSLGRILSYFFDSNAPTVQLMDLYTVARILHQFKNSKSGPDTVSNAIFYGGEAHSISISDHLIDLGYKSLYFNRDESGCILVPRCPSLV